MTFIGIDKVEEMLLDRTENPPHNYVNGARLHSKNAQHPPYSFRSSDKKTKVSRQFIGKRHQRRRKPKLTWLLWDSLTHTLSGVAPRLLLFRWKIVIFYYNPMLQQVQVRDQRRTEPKLNAMFSDSDAGASVMGEVYINANCCDVFD